MRGQAGVSYVITTTVEEVMVAVVAVLVFLVVVDVVSVVVVIVHVGCAWMSRCVLLEALWMGNR